MSSSAGVAAQMLEELETGHFRHHRIQQQNIGPALAQLSQARGPRRRLPHLVNTARQQLAHQISRHLLVVDEQHAG